MSVNEQGELEAETELGIVKFTKPVAYQEIDGKNVYVEVAYSVQGLGAGDQEAGSKGVREQGDRGAEENSKLIYSFTVASYDTTKDLIIDPPPCIYVFGGK